MNEDEVIEGCIPLAEVAPSRNSSKDPIPAAEYYLVRPKDSEIIFIMDTKPDYKEEPFYNNCKGCRLDMNNYLINHSIDRFDTEDISMEEDNYLDVLGICPPDNSISYVFGESKIIQVKPSVGEVLASDTYEADKEVAEHYKLFSWHIAGLLDKEPFKSYIQEHLDEFKVEKSEALPVPNPTKESKSASVILNKRLLI